MPGTVGSEAVTGKDGGVVSLHILAGHPLPINSAREAAKKYRYLPTTCGGIPIEVLTTIEIPFKTEIGTVAPMRVG